VQNLGKDEGTSFAFDLHAPRFFDEMKFVIDLDFIQQYSKRFINHELLQIRDHDLISYLKLKGFSSYVGITLLAIVGSLDTALDLNDLLNRLVDDLWASELSISDFTPADR
ncbi:hypothetical protein Tco_1411678, partial [Tanacetum coccineum]